MITKLHVKGLIAAILLGLFLVACQNDNIYEGDNDRDDDQVNRIGSLSADPITSDIPDSLSYLNLLFQSTFEGNLSFAEWGNNNKIVGHTSGLAKSDWDKLQTESGVKTVFFNYTGGNETQRYAKIVPDPKNPANKVLVTCLKDWWVDSDEGAAKARVQLGFHKLTPEAKELYQSVRMYFSDGFHALEDYPGRITWCTIGELWNNTWWENDPYGFRVSLGVGKPKAENRDLYFTINGQNNITGNVWNADNYGVTVPVEKWFTMKYYFKDGDRKTGRFCLTIQVDGEEEKVVADVHHYTHHTSNPASKGMQGYDPIKLYTSKDLMDYVKSQNKSLAIYWDDLKVWRD